jgi:hypothetical protein
MRRRRIVTAASRKQEAEAAERRQAIFDGLLAAFWGLNPTREAVLDFVTRLDDEEYLRLLADLRSTVNSGIRESAHRSELVNVFVTTPDRHTAALEALPQNVRDYWGWRTIESRLEGLRGLTREELIQLAKDLDIEKYHGKLMWPRYDAYMLRQALMFFHDEFTDRLSPFAAGRKLTKKDEHVVGQDDFEPCDFDEGDEEIELDEDDEDEDDIDDEDDDSDEDEDEEIAIPEYNDFELRGMQAENLARVAMQYGLSEQEAESRARNWLQNFIRQQQSASGL